MGAHEGCHYCRLRVLGQVSDCRSFSQGAIAEGSVSQCSLLFVISI